MNELDRDSCRVGAVFGLICILIMIGLLKACDASPACEQADHGFFRGCLR